jgi:hypothetical protein
LTRGFESVRNVQHGINKTEEERGRRKAAILFLVVYVLFMLTVIALMAIYSHEHGYGWL